MGRYLEKKEVKDALKKSKEIEKERIFTPAEEVEIQKEAVSFAEKLRRLLAPAWFIKDVHDKSHDKKNAAKNKAAKPVIKKTGRKSK